MTDFTFKFYKEIFQKAKDKGYNIITCLDYFLNYKKYENEKVLVNRVDVDLSCQKVKKACEIFNELMITASVFFRLHGDYNVFSFENYACIKYIKQSGFEIGLHSEIIDCENIWNEDSKKLLVKDINIFKYLDVDIYGIASHNGLTGYNNLDFWTNEKPESFGLVYEAYNPLLFNTFFTSDSLVTEWKCYKDGKLVDGDKRSLFDHLDDEHKVIYCLTHPVQYEE
jgi:hypothetical protein